MTTNSDIYIRYGELFNMVMVLVGDAEKLEKKAEQSYDQLDRRSYIRAVWASIEGAVHALKQTSIDECELNPQLVSDGELAMLKEKGYSIDSKGKAQSKPLYPKITDNFLFAVKMHARVKSLGYSLDTSTKGWNNFQLSLKMRHRITHPKSPKELTISDKEFETVVRGFYWVCAEIWKMTKLLDEENDKREMAMESQDDSTDPAPEPSTTDDT